MKIWINNDGTIDLFYNITFTVEEDSIGYLTVGLPNTFQVAPDADSFTLVLFSSRPANVYGATGHVLFDDMGVEIVPEPATLGLLLIGGLALLRRRG